MDARADRYRGLLICICLALAIVAIYRPLYKYEFVKYDDDTYVTDNPHIESGVNWTSIRWAFTTGRASNWHPVTWLSHSLDYELFGDWAGGHHIVNVLFHIANALLLFSVLRRMTGAVWPSGFVAAAFAVHPLHVESVAWVAERKDVLSTFFWILTMWAYVRYVEKPRLGRYIAAVVFFALGLMSKPMLVTMPFVLLLLDYWPLQRKFSYGLLSEKIPFFVLSLVSSVVTFIVQRSSGTMATIEYYGLGTRISNAIVSYAAYIGKMVWPSELAVLYPHPGGVGSITKVIVCALVLLVLSGVLIGLRRRRGFLAMGWLWYMGTLVPVIGLVQVGVQAMADRYTYMTLTGLFIIIAWGAKEFVPNLRYRNIVLSILAGAVLGGWGLTAARQVRYWKDSVTLFEHTLAVTQDNYIILSNYATYLSGQDRVDESIEQFERLLRIRPKLAEAHNNFGNVLLKAGRDGEAVEHFRAAIKYGPGLAEAHYNLAGALKGQGRLQEAVGCYEQAVKIRPKYVSAMLGLATVLNELRQYDEAERSCREVLELEPHNVFAHGYLSIALAGMGKTDEAIEQIRYVLGVRLDDVQMHRNLGVLLESKGAVGEAIESYRRALEIDPNDASSRQLLEAALKKHKPY